MAEPKKIPSTVKFPAKTLEKIREASERTGLSQLEIIRLCTAVGLEDLRKIDFNLPQVVSDTAEKKVGEKIKEFSYTETPTPRSIVADAPCYDLPFLGAVAAGEPVEAPRAETLTVSKQWEPGHFVVEVNGRSAEPDFPDGSRWIIDGRYKFTPRNGQVCVVSDGSGSYLKRWNRRRGVFESVNPEFNDIIPGEEAKLHGYPVERI